MSGSTRVAISIDGEVSVHMAGQLGGDYDTLCGLDGRDEGIGHAVVDVPRNGRARIDCDPCREIWKTARCYDSKDFRP